MYQLAFQYKQLNHRFFDIQFLIRPEREIMGKINSFSPVFAEILPLTLEEIFISETEVVGYDIKKLIF